MPPSGIKLLVAAVIVAAFVVAATALLRNPGAHNYTKPAARDSQNESDSVDIRTRRLATRSNRQATSAETKQPARNEAVTSGVKTAPVFSSPVTETSALTGYLVDSFETWTTIPENYRSEGLSVRDNAIVLSTNTNTTAPRYGELISPPLPLRTPAMAAPVAERKALMEGTSVELEIALSEDGKSWSSWMVADAYRPPDGKRVRPALQPQISEQEVDSLSRQNQETSSTHSGPFIRYRLSLSATGPASPAIADVRIWKREQN